MAGYPKRPKFFAHKFCRLMTKSAAAMTIGADVCWMLTVIVNQEDSVRYSKPIQFWNDQLSTLCGFGSRKRLVTARVKAIDAGWLYYEPGRKSTPGRYWVTLPDGLSIADDGLCCETDSEFLPGEPEEFVGNETERKDDLPVTKRNSKSTLTQRNGTANGTETEFRGNETEPQRGAMRNRKSAPFIPNPKPNPKERAGMKNKAISKTGKTAFDRFWDVVHRKVSKDGARQEFKSAASRVASEESITKAEAEDWIIKKMHAFSRSPISKGEFTKNLHPERWLKKGRYHDDEKLWQESTTTNGQPIEPNTARRI